MIDANQTLGHVATAHPASTLVFLRHRLDFCCGGGRQLSEACRAAGLDPAKVITEIEAEGAVRSPERWDTKPLPELIDFIVSQYHEPLRKDLPALIAAAQRVERVHGAKASCPKGLASFSRSGERAPALAKRSKSCSASARPRGAHVHMRSAC